MVKKSVRRKVKKGPKNPWFERKFNDAKSGWGFSPINWRGWAALILLVGINVFASQYFNLNILLIDNYLKMGVVFLLSLAIFILIAKRKTRGVLNDK